MPTAATSAGASLMALLILAPAAAPAAPVTVAVADFDYADSSGEVRDQTAIHAQRLRALQEAILRDLAKGGTFSAVPLHCAKSPCSAESLDQDGVASAARTAHARYVVFGGVHKMSTLIQWGRVEVMDTDTGKSTLSRTVTFRGDSDDAWQHAGDYIGDMLAASIAK